MNLSSMIPYSISMLLICFFSIIVCCVLLQVIRNREGFEPLYLSGKTKCFACERSLPDGFKWLGQPTKDFSSQRELSAISPYGGYGATPQKCFACRRQLEQLDSLAIKPVTRHDAYSGWRFPGSYVD